MKHGPVSGAVPHKLIITGTGRAGTTFLVRLLTALGQPTGFDQQSWRRDFFDHCAAGLEHNAIAPGSPYIVKNPDLCVSLRGMLARGEIIVDHAIVPVRELADAAASRARIGGQAGEIPGGLVGTSDPDQQCAVLAERFHTLVHTLVTYAIPHTFLLFPRFVEDAGYAYQQLSPIFPDVTRKEFQTAFEAIADPAMVHRFERQRPAPNGRDTDVAVAFRRQKRRSQWWRWVRRIVRWSFAVVVLAVAVRLFLPTVWPGGGPDVSQTAATSTSSAATQPNAANR